MLHARSTEGTFSLHARGVNVGALSSTARRVDNAFSLPAKCIGGILREKNEDLRPFSKVDEVDVYPYHLGEYIYLIIEKYSTHFFLQGSD